MSGKKLFLIALAAFALLFVGGFVLWNEGTKAELEAAKQRLRDAHLPMTVDDIRPPPVPDAENAAPLIAKIEPMLKALPQVDGKDFTEWFLNFQSNHKEERLDEAATKELADQLDSPAVQAVLGVIREAAAKKGFESKTDYSKPLDVLLPDVTSLRKSALLLLWHARLLASRGQADAACAEVWAMASFADFLQGEPALINYLTQLSIWTMVRSGLEQLAAVNCLPSSWNHRFSERLAGLGANLNDRLARAIDGERIIFGQWAFESILVGKKSVANWVSPPRLDRGNWKEWLCFQAYRLPGVVRVEYAEYLDRMRERRVVAVAAPLDRVLLERKLSSLASPRPNQLIMQYMVPTTGDMIGGPQLRFRERFIVTQVGLALERYREVKGSYPAALADIAPDFIKEITFDVFTGKRLIYRTEPGGALVYSVGKNLKDDGGVDDEEADRDDINWASGAAAIRKFAPKPKSADSNDEPSP